MSLALIILAYFIVVPLGIIAWKIVFGGMNINYNERVGLTDSGAKE